MEIFKLNFICSIYFQVVGWGFTEKNLVFGGLTGESSPILLKAEIPVISTIDCREIVKNLGNGSFFPFVTGDKFCGLYVNGKGKIFIFNQRCVDKSFII